MRPALPALPAYSVLSGVLRWVQWPAVSAMYASLLLAGCEGASVTTRTPLPDASATNDATSTDSSTDSSTGSSDDASADTAGSDAAAAGSDVESGSTDCGKVVWAQAKTAFMNNCAECHDIPDGVFKAYDCVSTATRKSKIKSEVSKNYMPPDGNMSDADKQLIIQWVNDGALCACP